MDKRSFEDHQHELDPVPPEQDQLELEPVRERESWEAYNTNFGRMGIYLIVGVFGLGMGYVLLSTSPRRNLILLLTPVTLIAIVLMARYIVYSYNRDKRKLREQQNPHHHDHAIR